MRARNPALFKILKRPDANARTVCELRLSQARPATKLADKHAECYRRAGRPATIREHFMITIPKTCPPLPRLCGLTARDDENHPISPRSTLPVN
jgi:hypothetical protein